MNNMTSDGLVKISANLPASTFTMLKGLAQSRNTSMTEVLRQAIATEQYLASEVSRGSKIVVQTPGSQSKDKELIFRDMNQT